MHGCGSMDAPGIEVCLEGLQQLQTVEEAQGGGHVGRTGGEGIEGELRRRRGRTEEMEGERSEKG